MKRPKPSKRPWLQGPVAWQIAEDAAAILTRLEQNPKRFLSLRQAAAMLGISTQPVRDWLRSGLLQASGPRQRIPVTALTELVQSFQQDARPYPMQQRLPRLWAPNPRALHLRAPQPFGKLWMAAFVWPSKRPALRPPELAKLIGCHPSLILKAIHAGALWARHPSPHRWEVTRRNWITCCQYEGLLKKTVKRPAK